MHARRRLLFAWLALSIFSSPAAAQVKAKRVAVPEKDEWKDATHNVRVGDLTVFVSTARLGKVAYSDLGRQRETGADLLSVFVGLHNHSDTRKHDYKGWSTKTFDREKTMVARASDEFGNTYKRISFSLGERVVGQLTEGESIYPEKTLADILVFEVPIDKATEVRLLLPGEALGLKEPLRLKFPVRPQRGGGTIFDLEYEAKQEARRREAALLEEEDRLAAEAEAKKTPEEKAAEKKQADEAAAKKAAAAAKQQKEKDEKAADSKLRAAESLLKAGKREAYRKVLKEIVEKYPETEAGKKAAKALK